MADFIDWPGRASTYRYWFLDSPSNALAIKPEAGNYMFVRPTNQGWVPVYIGIADKLNERIPGHERWNEAAQLGATSVMSHTNSNAANRAAEEKDLIEHWDPPLNTQHRLRRMTGGS